MVRNRAILIKKTSTVKSINQMANNWFTIVMAAKALTS